MPTSTRRLYYDDAYMREFPARIVHCEVLPPDVNSGITGKVWGLVLDRTAFYPTSGGQPHDLGKIGDVNVLDVRDDGDEIIHVVDRRPDDHDVNGCINWPRRFDHMQQHTGQHLLSAMFQERFGLPTVSFHLGEEICTIDLRGPEPKVDILEGAQRAANKIIFEDRPISIRYGTADQLSKLGVRKQVDREGMLRAVEIESADLQPCGGTHVKSTGQIGLILIRRVTKVRQDWRVEFVCGARAEKFARQDFSMIQRAAHRLGYAPEEIVIAVERTLHERDTNFKQLGDALKRLAAAEAALLVMSEQKESNGIRIVSKLLTGTHSLLIGLLATELTKTENTVAVLAQTDDGQLIVTQHPSVGKDMSALLKSVFAKFPGKGGGPRDYARGKLTDPAQSQAAIDAALEILSTETASQSA